MYRIHDTSLALIFLALLTFGLSYFFGFLNWDPNATSVPITRWYSLQLLCSNLSTIFFISHFELLENDRPQSWFFSLSLFLLSPLIIINTYEILTANFLVANSLKKFSIILTQIASFMVFFVILIRAADIYDQVKRQTQQIDTEIVLHFLAACFFLIHVIFEILDEFISVYNTPWLLLTIGVFSISYLKDPAIIILKPTNIMLYGVISDSGLPYYFRDVSQFDEDESRIEDTTLIAGFVNALSSFSREITGTKTQVESMQFGDRTLIIDYKKPLYLVCIASKSNYFLNTRLDQYIEQAVEALKQQNIDTATFVETSKSDVIFEKLNSNIFHYLEDIELK